MTVFFTGNLRVNVLQKDFYYRTERNSTPIDEETPRGAVAKD
jgi:hypothetical protein